MVERTNEKLWEECKKEAMIGKSRWDARIAQRAVRMYKSKGGKYKGEKPKNNSLNKWTREKWAYGSKDKNKTGRYLPEVVWSKLTPEQKRITNRNKRGGVEGENVPWEPFVIKAFRDSGIKHTLGKKGK